MIYAMSTSILQRFGNGKICIVQLEWMPIIHTKCPPSLGMLFYMANTLHVFLNLKSFFSLLEEDQQNAPEKVLLELGVFFFGFGEHEQWENEMF